MTLPEDFADQMYAMANLRDDEQVKLIFDVMFSGGPHTVDECDQLLASLEVSRLSADQMLSLLTATQHVRSKMSMRDDFIARCGQCLRSRWYSGREVDAMLSGYAGQGDSFGLTIRFPNGVAE